MQKAEHKLDIKKSLMKLRTLSTPDYRVLTENMITGTFQTDITDLIIVANNGDYRASIPRNELGISLCIFLFL